MHSTILHEVNNSTQHFITMRSFDTTYPFHEKLKLFYALSNCIHHSTPLTQKWTQRPIDTAVLICLLTGGIWPSSPLIKAPRTVLNKSTG